MFVNFIYYILHKRYVYIRDSANYYDQEKASYLPSSQITQLTPCKIITAHAIHPKFSNRCKGLHTP